MTKSILLFSYFLCSLSFTFAQEYNERWQELQNAAHQISLCIYNSHAPHCKEHGEELRVRQEASPEDDMEVSYFLMGEEWAHERTKKWANDHGVPQKNCLILFDTRQRYNPNRHLSYRKPLDGFLILHLLDSIHWRGRPYDEYVIGCSLSSINGEKIVKGNMWREFVSGRGGMIADRVYFNIMEEEQVIEKFQHFVDKFNTYQQSIMK